MSNDFLYRTFLGNTIYSYLWFAGIIILGLIFSRLLSKLLTFFVFNFVKQYSIGVGYDKLLVLLKKPTTIFILLITFYFAFNQLVFPAEWNFVSIEKFGLRMFTYRLFLIAIIVLMHKASLTESKTDDQLVPFFIESLKVVFVIFSVFFIFGAVFKLNIASLIAGLGIGGLAIALAAKESLENLLGSFTIFLDKPFVIGDYIKVGTVEGHVEKIGFRSTRIRTMEKSFLTVPNKKLVEGELDNLSLRIQRLAKFNIGLTYETKAEQFKKIINEIQTYIDNHSRVLKNETRVRLHDFDQSAASIMITYFVDTMEYDVYLNVREEINYKIMEIVEKNGSSFAYPTTTVLMKK